MKVTKRIATQTVTPKIMNHFFFCIIGYYGPDCKYMPNEKPDAGYNCRHYSSCVYQLAKESGLTPKSVQRKGRIWISISGYHMDAQYDVTIKPVPKKGRKGRKGEVACVSSMVDTWGLRRFRSRCKV